MDPQQQQQLAMILGADPAPFETLISQLMSSANDQRSQAESLFHLCRDLQPDALAGKLATTLHSSSHHEIRAMSAILLRKLLTRDSSLSSDGDSSSPSYLWPRLSPASQASLKSLLLATVQREEVKSIAKKLCDTVSELAAGLLPDDAWPELLPFMFQSVTSDNPRLQESALLIFSQLAQYIGDTLLPHLPTLHSVLLSALSHPTSADVRIAALGAAINLVQCLPSAADRDRFGDLLPAMMRTLTESLNSGKEATAQEALELLIELAGTEPRFLRRQLPDVVSAMLQIAEADHLEEGTRHLAVEFVITLAEARERAPGMMRRLPQFIGRLFAVLMKMLLDIEDEPAWHSAESEDEDAGETSNYSVAQECLDRLSIALGGNTIVPVASELLPAFLAAPEWQKHHVALITLAQIAEGCSKVMIKNLEQVVTMVLNSFQDPHPRVRWAAINAIGQLSTDLGPDLQVQYHQRVLPALASAMDDFQNPRVQAHAASAVLNFSENCTPDILQPYLDGIVSKLLVLLQNGKQMVQEGALTALASVADSSQEQFQKYYDAVMPYLKAILVNATDKSKRMLRAKSMECISLVGMAVGKDKFKDDARQVMEVLMTLQGSQMDADDPITSYMLQAWARLCKCLGQDFLPYMSVVMPPLLQSAQLKPDVTITSADSDEDIEESDDESIETITLGDKRIGIRTSVLEEKATACNMLCCYADELKEGFYPWIDQVAPTLVPLLKFYFHEEVRKAAVSAMPELLRSAKLAMEKGLAQGRDESYVKQLSDYIIPSLLEALHKEPETEICSSMLDSLNECLQLSGPLLDESQVRSIVDEIKHAITASATRKRERAERTKAEDFDAEEGELLKEENEQEEEVFDQVGDCLGTLIKTFKASFLPFFDELAMYITPMLGKDKTAEERRIAICIFDDVAEQCQEAALRYYDTYLPFLLEACNDENADVRQAAVYGVGVCAEFGGSVFRPLVGEALSKLNNVIRHPDALHSDNVMAYDNAVSALGKICQFHRDSIDAAQVVPAWLSCLPIKGDLIEAKVVHEQLCSMVERSDRELLGPNNQYFPKIISVFAETPDGDIIDCVGIYDQPAFDNPLLKNHTIQMRPSSYSFGVYDKEKLASEKGTGSIFQPWRRYGQCPENTVPIRRMKRDDLLRARSAGRFSRLSHRTGPYPILPHNVYGPEYARAGLQGELYRGANAVMDVWSPSIEVGDVSKASITLMSGSGLDINLIEAGWTVDRRLYNDDKPRFTACWTRDDFTETGCFNLECSGFVQTSNQVGLTASIEPVSTYGGDRYAFYLAIHQDASTKNWWLAFEDEMVGYFPNSLFTNLGDGANFILWGGTVSTLTAGSDPHTTTKMGSGHFPEENYALASEIKKIQYLDSAWALQRPTKLDMIRQQPNCYNLTIGETADDNSGVYLLYGGPGRNPSCP